MPCSSPCVGHTHRQGRGCECDRQATVDALAPLWQRPAVRFASYIHDRNGGHDVDGSISFFIEDTRTCNGAEFPVEADPADEPLDTPAAAADRTYAAWMALCALAAVACWAIAIYRFTH